MKAFLERNRAVWNKIDSVFIGDLAQWTPAIVVLHISKYWSSQFYLIIALIITLIFSFLESHYFLFCFASFHLRFFLYSLVRASRKARTRVSRCTVVFELLRLMLLHNCDTRYIELRVTNLPVVKVVSIHIKKWNSFLFTSIVKMRAERHLNCNRTAWHSALDRLSGCIILLPLQPLLRCLLLLLLLIAYYLGRKLIHVFSSHYLKFSFENLSWLVKDVFKM